MDLCQGESGKKENFNKKEMRRSENFKTGALYDYLREPQADVPWAAAVWFSRTIPRHCFHTWLVIQDRDLK